MRDPSDPYADERAMATPTPPPKSDYAEIAERGMRHLRAVMGWQPPQPRQHPENPPGEHTDPETGAQMRLPNP